MAELPGKYRINNVKLGKLHQNFKRFLVSNFFQNGMSLKLV